MKKYLWIITGLVAVFALSGCSGVGAGENGSSTVVEHQTTVVHETIVHESSGEEYVDNAPIVPAELSEVDILDLDEGYTIEGYSSYGNGVVFKFYEGRYSYERTDDAGVVRESFSGYFELQNGAIKIYFGDDDGGGYAIETHNGLLEEGYYYDIIGVRDDITVTRINKD